MLGYFFPLPSPALFWALISKQTLETTDGERFEISGFGKREIPSDKRQTVV